MNYANHKQALFIINFFFNRNMSKGLLAKYYQDNKERLQKQLKKNIKVFLKQKKKIRQQDW